MNYSLLDDEALLRLVVRAQENALSELYERYGRLVYSLAYNVTGEASDAEEVTQDVFLRVWRKAETYRAEQGKVATWLTGIARNRAIDLLRRARSRPEGKRADWTEDELAGLPDGMHVEREVEGLQRRQRMSQALAQLPEDQRTALYYAFLLGYSHSETAAALNEPLGTVKTRIRLAMQKLRQILQDEQVA
ncbi:MAG: sigma-70 family RNA polymerase sigma factor [Chloroflexi bacterium]|nr:sigma-70 family RNA polymerase sigma factor [Chloroflexota bacterium]